MTKFLKAIMSIALFEFFDLFVIELAAIGITTLFNGSASFIICIQMILRILLILALVLWMKKKGILVIFYSVVSKWVITTFQDQIVFAPETVLIKLPDSVYLKGLGISIILNFAVSIIIAPIIEELFYRSYLMNCFFKNNRFHFDILLSAFFFSAAHFVYRFRDPIMLTDYFIFGVFLAAVYKKHRDLRLVVLLHSFSNFLVYWEPIWIFVYNYIYWHFLV
jgi:membrane protease YdiL (CAAX protease family)